MTRSSPVLLVTGASSGIGEATAKLFAAHGYRVVLAARRRERLEALGEEIRKMGGEALPVVADLTDLRQIEQLVDSSLSDYGRIDVLFNNAGMGRMNWLENLDPVADIEALFRVNLLGVVQTTRAVLPHMIMRKSGHIINMASMAGYLATPTYSIYAASKFAVRGFSDALRREVGVYGIRVSGIYPSGVETEFARHAGIKRKTGISTPARLRLSAEQVAISVLDVVHRPRRAVLIPAPMRMVAWFGFFFPGFVDWIIEKRFTRPERGL